MSLPYRARLNEQTFLNLPGYHAGAYVYTYVEDTSERGLGVGLELQVDRQRDVAAGAGVAVEAGSEQHAPARVALDGDPLRAAQQPAVLHLLGAAGALAVDVREAEQAGGEGAVRIRALGLGDRADARQLERAGPSSRSVSWPICTGRS